MKISLDTIADFTWDFGSNFLLETNVGNFIWSDPDYNGDNTIKPYNGDIRNFTSEGFMGRDKGIHSIREYCGDHVKFIDCD